MVPIPARPQKTSDGTRNRCLGISLLKGRSLRQLSAARTTGITEMKRMWKVVLLVALLFVASSAAAESPWTVKVETDKMTDKKVLTAAVVGVGDKGHLYELRIICRDREMTSTVATFDATGNGLDIGWTDSYSTLWLNIGLRMDNSPVIGQQLTQAGYSNLGSFHAVFGTPQERLLLSGVFPEEVVEFQFSALTPDERQLLSGPLCAVSEIEARFGAEIKDLPEFVVVVNVPPDSPASRAGVLPGDIIVDFDGATLVSSQIISGILRKNNGGKKIIVKVRRNGEVKSVEVQPY